MHVKYNPNPSGARVDDCAVRALAFVTGQDWRKTYIELTMLGYEMSDMPNANSVVNRYLTEHGFKRYIIPDSCPHCYTVKDFCKDHQSGDYVLGTGSHVVGVRQGDYYDTFDSGDFIPICYWKKG